MALSDLNVTLGLVTKSFEKELNKTQRQLGRFQRNIGNIGSELTNSISIPIIGAGAAAVSSFADIERSSKALETALGGNAEAARIELELLRKAAENPGLGFEQAIQGSVRLQAVGFSAEQSRRSLLAFGNAIALAGGTAVDLDGVSLALTQIASKGKVSAEEINQISERVPQLRKVMQETFGTTAGKEIEELGVSAEDFVRIVTAEFEKLPQAQNTLSNSFQNLGQTVRLALAGLGEEINAVFDVQGLVERISERVTSAIASFKELDDQTKRNILRFAAVAASIGPVLIGVSKLTGLVNVAVGGFGSLVNVAKLLPTALIALNNPATVLSGKFALLTKSFSVLKTSFLAFFTNPVGIAITAIAGIGVGLVQLYKNNEQFRAGVTALGVTLKQTFEKIFGDVGQLKDAFFAAFRAVNAAIASFANFFIASFRAITKRYSSEITAIGKVLRKLLDISVTVFDSILGIAIGFVKGVTAIFKRLFEIIAETANRFKEGFEAIKDGDVKGALKAFGEGLKRANPVGLFLTEGKSLAQSFTSGFQDGFETFSLRQFAKDFKTNFENELNREPVKIVAPEIETPEPTTVTESFRPSGSGQAVTSEVNVDFLPVISQLETQNSLIEAGKTLYSDLSTSAQESIAGMLESGNVLKVQYEEMKSPLEEWSSILDQLNLKMGDMGEAAINFTQIGAFAITQFGNAFADAIGGVRSFAVAFKQATANIIELLVKQGVAAAIANSLKKGSVLGPFAIPLAAAAGVAAKAVFSKVVGLKDGGIIPPGFPNDTFPAFLSSGEAVIPLNRLNGLMGDGGGGYIAETRLRGEDIYIAYEKAKQKANRFR